MEQISPDLQTRFETALRQTVRILNSIRRGYTPALRLRAQLGDGSTVFIKCATTDLTAEWLRREYEVYTALQASFMPRMVAWDDAGEFPLLVLEDLSTATWPPPWTAERITQVQEMLAQLAEFECPNLSLVTLGDNRIIGGWQTVANDPAPFLSLGLASENWLQQALPTLLSIDECEAVRGNSLVHCDVRSDNLCFVGNQAVLIDWNVVCKGSPLFDLASWLPSLENEGGPAPDSILPGAGALASILSGYFAARAGQPIIPNAPRVREVQRQQLLSALPWTVRALDLPAPDGPIWDYNKGHQAR